MTAKVSGFQQQVAPLVAELYASADAHDSDRHLAIYARDPALLFIDGLAGSGSLIRALTAHSCPAFRMARMAPEGTNGATSPGGYSLHQGRCGSWGARHSSRARYSARKRRTGAVMRPGV